MSLFLLGLKALWRQRTLLLFTSTGLAAVLGPLLLLYGFKFGVIAALLAALRDDPTNREIVLRGNYVLQQSDIEKFRSWPEVTFVVPATRTIAARIELVGSGRQPATATSGVLPSGPGDPLLPAGMNLQPGQIALSGALAERLRAKIGDHVTGRNRRTTERGPEDITFDFTVVHVVDRRFATGDRAYVPSATLFNLEAFLDGYEVPDRNIAGKPLAGRADTPENVRMYARAIEDVPVLDHRLSASGFNVYSKADDVAGILGLNRSLVAVFALIAGIGSLGYAVSLAASLLGSIAQQRKLLSLIRLMGAGRRALLLFPLAQGLAIAGAGFAMSTILFVVVAWIANTHFAAFLPINANVCRLGIEHFLVALLATLLIVGLVVAWVGRTLLSVSPAEVLHAE
ncbi:MAG: ABC transporter permease [Reyranellales bacterium]